MSEALTSDEVIAQLGLKPHPEGGWFRETFRDPMAAHIPQRFSICSRGASGWHKVDAAELWHWHGGAPLWLEVKQGEARHEFRLGPDWHKGNHPHAVVPAHAWQSARSLVALVTRRPGFDFAGFEMAPEGWEP